MHHKTIEKEDTVAIVVTPKVQNPFNSVSFRKRKQIK